MSSDDQKKLSRIQLLEFRNLKKDQEILDLRQRLATVEEAGWAATTGKALGVDLMQCSIELGTGKVTQKTPASTAEPAD